MCEFYTVFTGRFFSCPHTCGFLRFTPTHYQSLSSLFTRDLIYHTPLVCVAHCRRRRRRGRAKHRRNSRAHTTTACLRSEGARLGHPCRSARRVNLAASRSLFMMGCIRNRCQTTGQGTIVCVIDLDMALNLWARICFMFIVFYCKACTCNCCSSKASLEYF